MYITIHQILAFKTLLILKKKCTVKPYSFLLIDNSLASDNPLRFRRNLSERIQKLIMTIDDKIRDQKLQYDINREAAKYQHYFASSKIDRYEYLTGEAILPSSQSRIIEKEKKLSLLIHL